MSHQRDADERDRIDAAFNRVLAAEAQSRERVADCRRTAAALIAAAQDRARTIAERTERRVQRTQEIADAGVARALRELLAPGPTTPPTTDDPCALPLSHLDQVLDTLIGEVLAPPGAVPNAAPRATGQ